MMPITLKKQSWDIGDMVKVGFLELQVVDLIPTPRDYLPDKYWLINPNNDKKYTFTPYNGLEKDWC
jgi:hypothetical protein